MPTPTAASRYFLLDDARTCSTFELLQTQLIFLRDRGIDGVIWHFSDDQGCRIRFESVPEIGETPSFSVEQVRQLVRFARNIGLTLIPELASLGHSRFITRLPQFEHLNENDGAYSGMCPVHAQTREVLAALLRETIELFDAPAIHVGMDEVEIGQHPLTAAALKNRSVAELLADHLCFLRQIVVEDAGREMWMWGDGLLNSPELMERTPKDIVVCNWQYRPAADVATTRLLLDAGFDVVPSSAILSHDQTLFPSNAYALQNIRTMRRHDADMTSRGRIRGHLVTTWIPCRSIGEAQWLGWHLAADLLADPERHDQAAAIQTFGQDFYGLENLDQWQAICDGLLNNAPQRKEWLRVVKLDLDDIAEPQADRIIESAELWQVSSHQLSTLRPRVRKNAIAFEAFQLLFELLEESYSAARYLLEPAIDPIEHRHTLLALIKRRKRLLDALNRSWDREHFANDPAKTQPVIHFFRDDHLLITVQDGLNALHRHLANVPAPLLGADVA